MAPNHREYFTTDGPSRLQLVYKVSIYMEADQIDYTSILHSLNKPSTTGRPLLPRPPIIKLYLVRRSRQTRVPRKVASLTERLKKRLGRPLHPMWLRAHIQPFHPAQSFRGTGSS